MSIHAIDYGFESTDEIAYDPLGLPAGQHKVMIVDEEVKESQNPNNPRRLVVTFEAVEGPLKGTKHIQSYNMWHATEKTRKIANESLKRIADATGRAVSKVTPLKNRVLVIEVRKQKDSDYFEIAKYHPESFQIAGISSSAPF